MTFEQALQALALGKTVRSPLGVPIRMQAETVPILVQGIVYTGPPLQRQPLNDNWFLCRFPISQHPQDGKFNTPCSFTDEQMRSTGWEVIEGSAP